MLLTFSHIVNNQRVPLLDEEGREVTLSVDAPTKTDAMNSQAVRDFIAKQTVTDCRIRRFL